MAQSTSRVVFGQPYLSGKSMLQDQILMIILPNGSVTSSNNLVVLIPDIWEDLKKSTGKYLIKQAKGNVWFWDDKDLMVTDTETEKNVNFKLQIPTPPIEIFRNEKTGGIDLEVKSGDNDWVKYWKNNYERRN